MEFAFYEELHVTDEVEHEVGSRGNGVGLEVQGTLGDFENVGHEDINVIAIDSLFVPAVSLVVHFGPRRDSVDCYKDALVNVSNKILCFNDLKNACYLLVGLTVLMTLLT
jgi:hypothetical protein